MGRKLTVLESKIVPGTFNLFCEGERGALLAAESFAVCDQVRDTLIHGPVDPTSEIADLAELVAFSIHWTIPGDKDRS